MSKPVSISSAVCRSSCASVVALGLAKGWAMGLKELYPKVEYGVFRVSMLGIVIVVLGRYLSFGYLEP